MKINYIKLQADKVYNFNLDKNLTIITDESGSGKTLMFKFIEFVLGSDGKHINIDEAKKVYPGLNFIEMGITTNGKQYIFKKFFDFKTQIICCDGEKLDVDYNDMLNEVINYNPTKVIKNDKEMILSTFTLREYIKSLFFNESRMTSSEHLTTDNYSDRTKIKNFYKYLVTGLSIDVDEAIKVKADIKTVSVIESSLKVLKGEIEQPSPEDKKSYQELKRKIDKNCQELKMKQQELKILVSNKNERSINIERLISLKQLFDSQLEDVISAKQFEHFLKDYSVECECGRKIKLINCDFQDDEYEQLKLKIKDISKQIETNRKEMDKINSRLDKIGLDLENLDKELKIQESEFSKLAKKIKDYDVYMKMLEIFNVKNKKKVKRDNIEKREGIIDEAFNNNIVEICKRATMRLKRWGFTKYNEVEFDSNEFDFKYNGTLRYLLSKGYKTSCTVAVIIEILLNSIALGINSLETIVIDSLWAQLFIEELDQETLINNIVKDLEDLDIQVIIIENKIPTKAFNNTQIYKLSCM